jgi:hypothetical protein
MHNRISEYLKHQPANAPAPGAIPYEVRLGLTRVTVYGSDAADAIRLARKAFCQQHPRMWDIIIGLEESRFAVVPVES